MESFKPVQLNEIVETLSSLESESFKIFEDDEKFEEFLINAEKNLASIPGAGTFLADVPTMISLVRAYKRKEYTVPPLGTIISIIALLLYVGFPADIIPDSIPVIGFADDAAALAYVVERTNDVLNDYREWRDSKQIPPRSFNI